MHDFLLHYFIFLRLQKADEERQQF